MLQRGKRNESNFGNSLKDKINALKKAGEL